MHLHLPLIIAQPGSRVSRSGHLRFRVFVGTSGGENICRIFDGEMSLIF